MRKEGSAHADASWVYSECGTKDSPKGGMCWRNPLVLSHSKKRNTDGWLFMSW